MDGSFLCPTFPRGTDKTQATAGLLTYRLAANVFPKNHSVTFCLPQKDEIQQRDCWGFSPHSLLFATRANQLRCKVTNSFPSHQIFALKSDTGAIFFSFCDGKPDNKRIIPLDDGRDGQIETGYGNIHEQAI